MNDKVVLIRRGLDSGKYGGKAHGIFNNNLYFDYFPVIHGYNCSEESYPLRFTYSDIICRLGGYLSDYLPKRLEKETAYINPNFDNLTFVERKTPMYKKFEDLTKGDVIVFYESLKLFKDQDNFNPNDLKADALFIIGFFILDRDPIITTKNSLPNLNELLYIRRRFRGHPLLYMNDPVEWDDFIFKQERIFLSGDQAISGLFEYALEISDSGLRKNNYQPVNMFFKERWGIDKSIMRTPLIFAKNPKIFKNDLNNWLTNARKTAESFIKEGWKPKFGFKVK